MKTARGTWLLAALTSLLFVAWAFVGANAASADSIQVQSYQRASQNSACTAQPGETPWQASWGSDSSWTPSWEQWANGGAGGWTCTRSIVWAKNSSASDPYPLGSFGPGGGLVFYIDPTSGLHYEMAPKSWIDGDYGLGISLCLGLTDVPDANGVAIGTGRANTAAFAASAECTSSAAAAVLGYGGTDDSAGQWFLPSKDELNALCYYSRHVEATQDPTVSCYETSGTTQNAGFSSGDYGFVDDSYWSSTQWIFGYGWSQYFLLGSQVHNPKDAPLHVRPIRSF